MRNEKLRRIFEDKKEAFLVRSKNSQARDDLNNLLNNGGFIYEVKYYRDGEDILFGKPLKISGYNPEDDLFQNIKDNIEGPALVKVTVIGNDFFEKIPIIKRK